MRVLAIVWTGADSIAIQLSVLAPLAPSPDAVAGGVAINLRESFFAERLLKASGQAVKFDGRFYLQPQDTVEYSGTFRARTHGI